MGETGGTYACGVGWWFNRLVRRKTAVTSTVHARPISCGSDGVVVRVGVLTTIPAKITNVPVSDETHAVCCWLCISAAGVCIAGCLVGQVELVSVTIETILIQGCPIGDDSRVQDGGLRYIPITPSIGGDRRGRGATETTEGTTPPTPYKITPTTERSVCIRTPSLIGHHTSGCIIHLLYKTRQSIRSLQSSVTYSGSTHARKAQEMCNVCSRLAGAKIQEHFAAGIEQMFKF